MLRTDGGLSRLVYWLTAGCCVLLVANAFACDTPVYDYTIHNWPRAPYQMRYFHDGDAAQDSEVNAALRAAAGGDANVTFEVVDVRQIGSPANRRVWERHSSADLPLYVLTTPRGLDLYAGDLDAPTLKVIIRSPKRRRLAEMLAGGKHGAMVVLMGHNAAENSAVRDVVKQVAESAKDAGCELGVVEVNRSDAAERWFVRQLLLVEDDLSEIPGAMVFGAFGRGYVLPPYLGKGITKANLQHLVDFINGPCSCDVKAANPGVDLLTDWDWEAHLADWSGGEPAPGSFVLFGMGVVQDVETAASPEDSEAGADDSAPEPQPTSAGTESGQVDASATTASARTRPSALPDSQPRAETEDSAGRPTESAATEDDESKTSGETVTAPELRKESMDRIPRLPDTRAPLPPAQIAEEAGERALGGRLLVGLVLAAGALLLAMVVGTVVLFARIREG